MTRPSRFTVHRAVFHPATYLRVCPYLLLFLLLPGVVLAQDASLRSQQQKLQEVRGHIMGLEKAIESDRARLETLRRQLRDKEVAIGRLRAQQRQLEARLAGIKDRLSHLQQDREQEQAQLRKQQELLAAQVRAAYISGRQDYLKLLLNQEDPALLGRTLVYYRYDNDARAERLRRISEQLTQLRDIGQAMRLEAATQQDLHQQIQTRLGQLQQLQGERKQVLTDLSSQLSDKHRRLVSLREDADKFTQLLDRLRQRATRQDDSLPFAHLKGQLQWPLKGRIARHFGSTRKDGSLKSQGVIIAVDAGMDVHAVAAGQVVFADWFRNLGLLIILDHGHGYMSLYGHNLSLYREEGDQVQTGEVIAGSGNSGGSGQNGLYFEIRDQGRPANPLHWLARRP